MASRGDIKFEEVQPNLCKKWLKLDFEETLDKTGSFTKLKSKDYFDEGEFPVIDQGDSFISGYINDEELLYQGELPVVIFGDHTRVVKYIDFQFATGADGTKVLKPLEVFDSMFYFYYLKSLKIPSLGYSRHFKILKAVKVPLPPLEEQQRIVAKLDELFGHLDSLKKRLENIPTLLKNLKQAILTQAVTGKLTQEWRVGKELEEWKQDVLGNLINGTPKNGAYYHRSLYGSGTRIIRIDCFYDGALKNWDVVQFVEVPESDISIYGLTINDILINRVNSIEYLGKCMLVDSLPQNCIYESNMMRIKSNTEIISPKYLRTYLTSQYGLSELRKNAKHSVNQASINQQDVKSVIVNFPPKEEQTEIVKRVENLFTKADKIEAQYQSLKTKIDNLPQAILAKAFKGELVEQLDTDGSAVVLLEEIKSLRENMTKQSVKKKRKK